MPESVSPQIRRERIAGVVVVALVLLALPTVLLLVHENVREPVDEAMPWFVVCFVLGILVPVFYWSPFRALGFVPIAAAAWFGATVLGCFGNGSLGPFPGLVHGIPLGLMLGAVARGLRGSASAKETIGITVSGLLGIGFAWVIFSLGNPFTPGFYLLATIGGGLFVWSWKLLFRPLFEFTMEPLLWLLYRVQAKGPGLTDFPRTGPCIVFANHACWFDPLFLAKVLPRPVTPMMTARFFDLPVLSRLMVMFGVIRVPEKAIKHETPEIYEAVAALDRGECLVIFPEGYLRRNEEMPLRRFGQGLWQILKARPNTPIYACWIEGGWGSYASYRNGKPMQNKKPDFRRPIGVGIASAIRVGPEVLEHHMATRIHLMNHVGAARALLGMPPLPPFELPAKSDE
jgi:1-acyl-sn-glycerol-3-phosphate acyltransferase